MKILAPKTDEPSVSPVPLAVMAKVALINAEAVAVPDPVVATDTVPIKAAAALDMPAPDTEYDMVAPRMEDDLVTPDPVK